MDGAMDATSRMVQLLGALRRERNGAVADSMRYYGTPYGLNYGVSLPTVRTLARAQTTDHAFARYLYAQDVRELKLAACWIADPTAVDAAEGVFWADGLLNSELAEELAFALLSRAPHFEELFRGWIAEGATSLQRYAVLMGAARRHDEVMMRFGEVPGVLARNPEDLLSARGVVALIEAWCDVTPERAPLMQLLEGLDDSPAATYVRDEVGWRTEY